MPLPKYRSLLLALAAVAFEVHQSAQPRYPDILTLSGESPPSSHNNRVNKQDVRQFPQQGASSGAHSSIGSGSGLLEGEADYQGKEWFNNFLEGSLC